MPTDAVVDYSTLTDKELRSLYKKGTRNEHTRRAVADYQRDLNARRKAAEISGGGEDVAHSANDSDTVDPVPAGLGATTGTPEPDATVHDLTPPEPAPKPAPPIAGTLTPATGAARRLRALLLIGITPARIAEVAGVPLDTIWWLTAQPPTNIPTMLHARIADVFKQLRTQFETPDALTHTGRQAARATAFAETQGWAGPFDWDHIDTDPKPSGRSRHRDPATLQAAIDAIRLEEPAPLLVSTEHVEQLKRDLKAVHAALTEVEDAFKKRDLQADSYKHELSLERELTAELRKTIDSNGKVIEGLRDQLHTALEHEADATTKADELRADIDRLIVTLESRDGKISGLEDELAELRTAVTVESPEVHEVTSRLEAFSEAVSVLPGVSIHFHIGAQS